MKRYKEAIKEHKKCKCGSQYHKKAIKFYRELLKKEGEK